MGALALSALLAIPNGVFAEGYDLRVEPTCTEWGYIEHHEDEYDRIVMTSLPPLGHSFSDWVSDEARSEQQRACQVCGYTESRHYVSETVQRIPWIKLYGSLEGINKKVKVTVDCEFGSQTINFSTKAVMTTQGHSTLYYNKLNYTLRLYDDPTRDIKHRVIFPGWQEEHKYILKANMYDPSQVRNVVGCRIWRSILETRPNLPERLAGLPTLGTVDGFPVSLWLNDEFMGLYTLNLHKDNDLFGMKTDEKVALTICNARTSDEALFLVPPRLSEDGLDDWETEFSGLKDRSWINESFADFVAFLNGSDDAAFKESLPAYLDVDAAIDYLIFLYALGLRNSGAKDLILLNYGTIWIPAAFDMDEAFGRLNDGSGYLNPSTDFLPAELQEGWRSGTDSVLWDRLLQNYRPEIKARYQALRQGPLTAEALRTQVQAFADQIPELLYRWDQELYPDRPFTYEESIQQIDQWIEDRLPVLDQVIGGF